MSANLNLGAILSLIQVESRVTPEQEARRERIRRSMRAAMEAEGRTPPTVRRRKDCDRA